jgi:hypothetical protein
MVASYQHVRKWKEVFLPSSADVALVGLFRATFRWMSFWLRRAHGQSSQHAHGSINDLIQLLNDVSVFRALQRQRLLGRYSRIA